MADRLGRGQVHDVGAGLQEGLNDGQGGLVVEVLGDAIGRIVFEAADRAADERAAARRPPQM